MGSRTRLVKRIDRLEQQVQQRQESRRQWGEQVTAVRRRWEDTLTRFIEVLPEDLHDRVDAALWDECCPLWRWLEDVCCGRSLLPQCLTADVMRRLVQLRLEAASEDFIDGVCLRCGLQYPLPNFPSSLLCSCNSCADRQRQSERQRAQSLAVFDRLFDGRGCPACGASSKAGEMNWAHLMQDGYWFTASPGGLTIPERQP
jgi:hypothetical protein